MENKYDVLSKYNDDKKVTIYGKNHQILYDEITKHVRGTDVIDVGCGYGHLLELIYNMDDVHSLHGVDPFFEEIFIESIKDKIIYKQQSIETLDFDVKFDTIICTEVIEHIPYVITSKFLPKNFLKHLNPKGRIIVSTPRRRLSKCDICIYNKDKFLKMFKDRKYHFNEIKAGGWLIFILDMED